MSNRKCEACGGRGWLLSAVTKDALRSQIQRCDACELYENDQAALEALVKAAGSQPALLQFVETVSRLLHEGEPGVANQPHEPSSEDAIATLNQLILKARQLLGTAEKCGECGETVPYLIGCPDGAEICQDCFDAGEH